MKKIGIFFALAFYVMGAIGSTAYLLWCSCQTEDENLKSSLAFFGVMNMVLVLMGYPTAKELFKQLDS